MDKMNWLLNIIQLACFVGIIYITWLNHVPIAHVFALIFCAVLLDVLSGYQARRETEKEHEN